MPAFIVPGGDILQPAQVLQEQWNMLTLMPELTSNQAILAWLAKRGLIRNTVRCHRNGCNRPCSLQAHVKSKDGYRWRCPDCRRNMSVRNGSFFGKSHIELKELILLLYFWSADTPQDRVEIELNFSRKTSVDWHNFVREVCEEDLQLNPLQLGGLHVNGQPKVVEVDESLFFRRKYNRGAVRPQRWVFGAVERETGVCLLQEVDNRDAATLIPIIQQWVSPGTQIMTDGWRAYLGIGQLGQGYQHDVVVHERHFVDPVNREIHTNNIENLWMRAKLKLKRQFGTSRPLFASYLSEFMWRSRHPGNPFPRLMDCIRQQYQ